MNVNKSIALRRYMEIFIVPENNREKTKIKTSLQLGIDR